MENAQKTAVPIVVDKHYKLILWLLPKMANFPKDQRYLLADKIEMLLLEILELLIKAVYVKEKRAVLMEANLKLDVLRFMVRIAKDMKYININSYDFFCRSAIEIGKMTGGWLKANAN